MRSVVWSSDTLDDFATAIAYIAAENPVAADLVAERIFAAIEMLADHPTGQQGRVKGTYEKYLHKTAYIVAYVMSERSISVVRLFHAKRDWRPGEWPKE